MWNIRVMFILIFIVLFIAFSVTFGYKAIYTYKSNKRILSGDYSKKPMLGLPRVFVMTIVSAIIAIILLIAFSGNSNGTISFNYNSYKEISSEEIESGYARSYNLEENIGYERYEKTVGNINFVYFVSKTENDMFHPTFICFVNYSGELENLDFGCNGEYSLFASEEDSIGYGFAGSNAENTKLFVGSIDEGYSFELKVFYYDQDESKNVIDSDIRTSEIEKYVNDIGSVTISLE